MIIITVMGVACSDESSTEASANTANTATTDSAGDNTGTGANAAKKAAAGTAGPNVDGTKTQDNTYVYSSVGKRDPFVSYLEAVRAQPSNHSDRAIEETEHFELDQYMLTGLMTGSSTPSALVEDPNRRGHVLHIGSRLGKNGGRITRITSKDMTVVEEFKDPKGQRIRVPYTITLRPEAMNVDNPPMTEE